MCRNCWEQEGSPATWNEQVARAVELLAELYEIHPTGGPLHAEVDDFNLDAEITPMYDIFPDAELDALYYDGWLITDLDPQAPAVVEGLGRSTRQICDELAALLNSMPVDDRYSAVARHSGYVKEDDRG